MSDQKKYENIIMGMMSDARLTATQKEIVLNEMKKNEIGRDSLFLFSNLISCYKEENLRV